MTVFTFLLIAAAIIGTLAGYGAASSDLLQQIFLTRKFSHRLAQCLCVAVITIILWVQTPVPLLRVIPAAVLAVYLAIAAALRLLIRKKASERYTEELRQEIREAALCTTIGILIAIGGAFVLCLVVASAPRLVQQFGISATEQKMCYGLIMGVDSMILAALTHYLIVLRLYPCVGDTPSRSLLQLRKALHSSYRI